MKKQILAILSIFLVSGLLAQQTDTIPFKKANTIIVITNQPDSVNFQDFQRYLLRHDYFLDKKDKDLFTLTTAFHALKKHPQWSYSYRFEILFHDHEIEIMPYWKPGVSLIVNGVKSSESDAKRWSYASGHGNVNHLIYEDLRALIEKYPGKEKVIYEQK